MPNIRIALTRRFGEASRDPQTEDSICSRGLKDWAAIDTPQIRNLVFSLLTANPFFYDAREPNLQASCNVAFSGAILWLSSNGLLFITT